ncbi:MAG: C39 family peptidase [Limisphaerales bacterium]
MKKSLGYYSIALAAAMAVGCQRVPPSNAGVFAHFEGLEDFSKFTRTLSEDGDTILISPPIHSRIPWNQLVISWNANAPGATFLEIEAAAISEGRRGRFYKMANWSPQDSSHPRSSISGQKGSEGRVDIDTLILSQPADAAQVRVTLGRAGYAQTALNFLGLSFANTKSQPLARAPNRAAWGRVVATPERSQFGDADARGWCSPASLTMVLSRWARILKRPELDLRVPAVAAAVYDPGLSGTGNWSFNTAFAGSFKGMRSYVTRMDDLSEVEDWIAAGIPVILSARWDWLRAGRPTDAAGHLVVCVGFTEDGDVVVNDPAAHLDRGGKVRQVYKREDVVHAWSKSAHAVYLVYPENVSIPKNCFGHWANR